MLGWRQLSDVTQEYQAALAESLYMYFTVIGSGPFGYCPMPALLTTHAVATIKSPDYSALSVETKKP